jgi:F-type H+-transporting ATPase subunit b
MIIDRFTVIAQALNFLVLVWLLKRFLYKPILDAIDAREKRIALALDKAKTIKTEALRERDDFKQKNNQFDQQRSALLAKATEEAQAEGKRLRSEARQAANAYTVKRQEALQREQQSLNDEITHRMQKEVFAIARKTLMDLGGVSLEERMTEVFKRRLQELDDEKRKRLASAFTKSSSSVVVRSAFLLEPEQQREIQQTLKETISPDINACFEIVPELMSGIELTADGHKIAWSISEYIESLDKSMTEFMREQVKPESGTSSVSSEEGK